PAPYTLSLHDALPIFAFTSTILEPVAGDANVFERVDGPWVSASLMSPRGPAVRSYSYGPMVVAAGATMTVADGATTAARTAAATMRLATTAAPRRAEPVLWAPTA